MYRNGSILQTLHPQCRSLPGFQSLPRPRRTPQRRVYKAGRGFYAIARTCLRLPIGSRGPPGRQYRRELQAMSNSLQLASN